MPPPSGDIDAAIWNELRDAYIAKFGDNWLQNLTRNLRPSPVKEMAARYGVSVKHVQEIKQKLWHLGLLVQSLAAGDLTGNPQTTLEEVNPSAASE